MASPVWGKVGEAYVSEVKGGDKKPLDDVTKIILKSGILTPRMLAMYVKPDHDIGSVVKYIQEVLMDLKTSNEKMIVEFQKKNDAEGIQPYRIRKRAHEHLLSLLKDETKADDDRFGSYKADLKKLDRIFSQPVYKNDLRSMPDVYKLLYFNDLEALQNSDISSMKRKIPPLLDGYADVMSPVAIYILRETLRQEDTTNAQDLIKKVVDQVRAGP
mgnify:CR=1 FL=1